MLIMWTHNQLTIVSPLISQPITLFTVDPVCAQANYRCGHNPSMMWHRLGSKNGPCAFTENCRNPVNVISQPATVFTAGPVCAQVSYRCGHNPSSFSAFPSATPLASAVRHQRHRYRKIHSDGASMVLSFVRASGHES